MVDKLYQYLDRHLKTIDAECSICYDKITSLTDIVMLNCCRCVYHRDCIMMCHRRGKTACPVCESPSPVENNNRFEILEVLQPKLKRDCLIHDAISELATHDLYEANAVEVLLSRNLNQRTFYRLPQLRKLRTNLLSNLELQHKIDESSFGLLNFSWPPGSYLVGIELSTLMRSASAPQGRWQVLVTGFGNGQIKQRIEEIILQLQSLVGGLTTIKFNQEKNIVTLALERISFWLTLEVIPTTVQNPYHIVSELSSLAGTPVNYLCYDLANKQGYYSVKALLLLETLPPSQLKNTTSSTKEAIAPCENDMIDYDQLFGELFVSVPTLIMETNNSVIRINYERIIKELRKITWSFPVEFKVVQTNTDVKWGVYIVKGQSTVRYTGLCIKAHDKEFQRFINENIQPTRISPYFTLLRANA